jgi:hypothetical protein
MDDASISGRIERLVAEEKELRQREEHERSSGALHDDAARLRAIQVELDVCWDLLRQRRALRETGGDPDAATPRDDDTVEHYLQ